MVGKCIYAYMNAQNICTVRYMKICCFFLSVIMIIVLSASAGNHLYNDV